MSLFRSNFFLVFTYLFVTIFGLVSSELLDDRTSKHFSLFSVVTFQNTECTSETSVSGGATQGTCYTSTECSDKGGTHSGNCASGFGVCCIFLNTGGVTSTITENRTRLRNSEFPSTATATAATTIVYTINKMATDICQLRLDFTTFVINGPGNTRENIASGLGTHCVDTLRVLTTDVATWTSSQSGTLCGALTGEHLYVDLTNTATDAATITLVTAATATVTPAIAQRTWDIKTSQIECFASYRAPNGCQRYFMEDYGKIISYNFHRVTGAPAPLAGQQNSGIELPLQRINTCIRRSKNMCCVEYKVCAAYDGIALADVTQTATNGDEGQTGVWNTGFSIDLSLFPFEVSAIQSNMGLVDSQCTGDYVEIPSSWSASCGAGTSSARGSINTRFCGARFGAQPHDARAITASTPVCDCSEPFIVRHSSDDANDSGGIGGLALPNAANEAAATLGTGLAAMADTSVITNNIGRGFCLDFLQIPCWQ